MLLSIVIPTKGRNKYIIEVINSLLHMNLNSTEIVIQDNNELDELSNKFASYISSGKIIYNHTKDPLSFISNFEKAVSLAQAKYITVIGDDDLVNPKIESIIADIAEKHDFEAIIPSTRSLFYIWPDTYSLSKSKRLVSGKGLLTMRSYSGTLTKVNVEKEIHDFFNNGCLDYLDTNMPRLYHGIVKRETIVKIKDTYGFFFGGLTPDIYASIMLSLHTKNVFRLDYPLTIPGVCRKSGSAASETGAHTGELSTAPHFNYRGPYNWNKKVPAIYTVETIWADSALAVLQDTQKDIKFNLEKLNFILEFKYPKLFKKTQPDTINKIISKKLFIIKYSFNKKLKWKAKKVFEKLGFIKARYIPINDLNELLTIVSKMDK
ncbi:glycosyltransferase [Providencia stuartii]|uniref:glycosyltransferase n=1 Tax=Providencia stuartii TaxID=588 RepID=UPI0029DE2316|nr:glycosyltransferase [Providencia stuartii]MDX7494646.1 glycosyltransferase [Providencia stuartii]